MARQPAFVKKVPSQQILIMFYKTLTSSGVGAAALKMLQDGLSRGGKCKKNGHEHRARTDQEVLLQMIVDINEAKRFAQERKDARKNHDKHAHEAARGRGVQRDLERQRAGSPYGSDTGGTEGTTDGTDGMDSTDCPYCIGGDDVPSRLWPPAPSEPRDR